MTSLAEAASEADASKLAAKLDLIVEKQQAIRSAMDSIMENMIRIGTKQEAEKEVLILIRRSEELLKKIKDFKAQQEEKYFDPTTRKSESQ